MSGADVYQPCVCGSGKKAKFCCAPVFDVFGRVAEYESREQFEKAAQYLESTLAKGVPSKECRTGLKLALVMQWLRDPHASDELIQKRVAATLDELLKESPEHPEVQALECLANAHTDQWHAGLIKLQRLLGGVDRLRAPVLTSACLVLGRTIAARGHVPAGQMLLLSAMVRTDEELTQRIAAERQEILSGPDSSFAFRGVYGLRNVEGLSEPHTAAFGAARQLFLAGRYHDTAKALVPLARENGNQPNIWWNIAICHLLCAEEPLAVRALHASVANDPDPDSAAESLALARLLDPPSGEDLVEQMSQMYKTESVAQLLTALNEWPGMESIEREEAPDGSRSVNLFNLYSAPLPPEESPAGTPLPELLGQVTVISAGLDTDQPVRLIELSARPRAQLLSLKEQFESRIPAALFSVVGEPAVRGTYSRDESAYLNSTLAEMPGDDVEENIRRRNARALDAWLNCPNALLQGATPLGAVGKPEMQIPLRAAGLVLATYQAAHQVLPEIDSLRDRLGLPPATKLDPANISVLQLDPLRLLRVDCSTLDPQTTERLLLTCLGLRHPALIPLARRLGDLPNPENEGKRTRLQEVALTTLRDHGRYSEAIELGKSWVAEGREQKRPLLERLKLQMYLLQTATMGNRPEKSELAHELWNSYAVKFPELRSDLVSILTSLVGEGPWSQPDLVGETAGSVTPGGIWTPEAGGSSGPPSQGLWLPGQ